MNLALAFTGHVVPADRGVLAGIAAGLYCVVCREQYRSWAWPDEQMIVSCQCPCVCHRHLERKWTA